MIRRVKWTPSIRRTLLVLDSNLGPYIDFVPVRL